MQKLLYFSLFITVFYLLFSCSNTASASKPEGVQQNSSSQPAWILNSKKDKNYFYVVGYTEDMGTMEEVKDKALQNAKGKIANNIFEETEVSKVFTTTGGLSEDENLRKSYQENVKSQSAVRLMGVEIEDTYSESVNDDGLVSQRVWVLAKISYKNLEKERTRILFELQRKLELVDNSLKEAQAFLQDGKAVDAVNSYINAAVSSTKVKERMDEFPIYVSKAIDVLQKLYMESSNNPKSIDAAKGDRFNFNLYYASDSGKKPVTGGKINFILRNNSGEYSRGGVTTNDGTAECKITRLREARNDNVLYAKLGIDFPEILDLGADYKKYYSSLKDSVEKVSTSTEFKTISSENRLIPTAVVAMLNNNGVLRQIPSVASEAQSVLLNKGYKVVRSSESVSLRDVYEAKQSALELYASKGIKRVFVLHIDSDTKPSYNETLERYMAVYSLSAQLIDTSTGEIISAKNIKLNATATTADGVFDSFVKACGAQLKQLID